MAYALKEKQRAFQREWARAKKARIEATSERGGEYRPLKAGIVTWKELQDKIYVDNLKTFDECVKKARGLIVGKRTDRLAVAALAMQACKVRHGGDFRSDKFVDGMYGKTLKTFAKELTIHPKTLCDWTRVLTAIRGNVPREAPIDFTAATIVVNNPKLRGDFLKNYTSLLNPKATARRRHKTISIIHSACSAVDLHGTDGWTDEDVENISTRVRIMLKAILGKERGKK